MTKKMWAALGALTLLGLCLRVIGLNTGLWWDEIFFLIVSVRHPLTQIVTVFPGDNQHPLYSVLAWMSVNAFGEEAWSLRLPAMIFGVASIPMLYLLGASVATRAEALLAAAFLAVSYHHVWFSQDARGYSALAFWTLASTYFLLRGIRSRTRAPWMAYGVVTSLGAYTHLTMMFLIVSHVVICAGMVIRERKTDPQGKFWRYPLQGFLLTAALTFLFYAPILTQIQTFFLHKPSTMKAVSTPRWALLETIRVLILGLGTQGVLIAAAFIVACGAWSYFRQSRVVFALFALPVALTAMGAFLARGTMYPRFYFFLIGFAVLILVRGIVFIPEWIAGRVGREWLAPALTAVLAAVFCISSAVSLAASYKYPKQDYEGAMHFVEAQARSGEPVVTAGASVFPLQRYFVRPWDDVETAEKMKAICNKGQPVWVVYTMPRYLAVSAPGVMDIIRKQFTVVRVFHGTVGDGDVYVARFQPAAI
ncbi:MAG: glycosyltransferase family 39 protein [Acidobacteriota bacterium]|nr:glycosyltransferase family 39 protein [Acidobacteriota bacterium]